MKTLVPAILFFMVLDTSTSDAQILRTFGLNVGYVKAEQRWNYSPQTGLDASWISPIWGLDAGVFAEFFDFPNFSLVAAIHYIQKGRTLTLDAVAPANNEQGYIVLGEQEIKQRFEYISIPVLAKLRVDRTTLSPFLSVGPSIEYLISFPPSDVYSKFNKTEFALTFGAGFELSLGLVPKLLAECRYSLSLTDTYKNDFVTIDNRVLEFLLGVAF